MCIASNGVPPTVSKRYDVQINCKCIHFRIIYPFKPTEQKFIDPLNDKESGNIKYHFIRMCHDSINGAAQCAFGLNLCE